MGRTYQSRLLVKRGRYGSSKAKAFEVMSDGMWYPSRHLCLITGITYHSLGRTLPRWIRFGYVTREPITFCGDYEYHLELKGKRWLRLAKRYLPNCQLFLNELKAWQESLPDNTVDDLITAPFNEFVTTLNKMIAEFKKNNNKGVDKSLL